MSCFPEGESPRREAGTYAFTPVKCFHSNGSYRSRLNSSRPPSATRNKIYHSSRLCFRELLPTTRTHYSSHGLHYCSPACQISSLSRIFALCYFFFLGRSLWQVSVYLLRRASDQSKSPLLFLSLLGFLQIFFLTVLLLLTCSLIRMSSYPT